MPQNCNEQFISLRNQYIESQFGRLNDVQKQAVFHTDGPLLILAGAGSGKTTVLVNRIANIIRFGKAHGSAWLPRNATEADVQALQATLQQGKDLPASVWPMLRQEPAQAWNVLAITFTNKAAGELKSRISSMLGETQGADVNASTFHSACVRMLRRDGDQLGYSKSFTIYDSSDQQAAMKEIYKQLQIDDKFLPPKSALGQISAMKDKLISPEEALATPQDTKAGLIAKIYMAYQKRLKKAGAMDFDDLIYNTVQLFQQNPEVLKHYQTKYKYVLVDEYQDTSVAQFWLVRMLAGGYQNICVVGDDDQSIYRFRGATIENILNFEQHFAGAKVIRLEQNYRSTSTILDAANGVIQNNMGRKGKTLWTQNNAGEKVHHYTSESEQDEAAHIATVIGENLKNGANLRDHAVLYRMNAQSNPVETYFTRAGIPYKIIGGQRFYDRKEVKDILAYMSIVANQNDDLRLKRIINEPPRKIGGTTLDRMTELAADEGVSLLHICAHADEYPAIGRAAGAIGKFYGAYQQLLEAADTLPLDSFVNEVLEISGYKAMLETKGDEGVARLENIGQLVSSVKTYADQKGPEASLSGFLEEVALIADIDNYNDETDVVVMMTLHSAKGLEFDYVFMVGMEQGIFPSDRSRFSDDDMEEERRLCYVGITRARKRLYMSSSQSRMIFGQTKRNPASAFIEEIDANLLEEEQSPNIGRGFGGFGGASGAPRQWGAAGFAGSGATGAGARTASSWNQSSRSAGFGSFTGGQTAQPQKSAGAKRPYQPGDTVQHKVFGRGTVLKATPAASDTIVEIQFEKVGVKKTMANYAPMQHADD